MTIGRCWRIWAWNWCRRPRRPEAGQGGFTPGREMRLNRPLPPLPPLRGVFITGTDTDVGKTWVAAGLTAALRQRGVKAVYFKPVQSGCPREGGRLIPTDADFARTLAGLTEPLEVLTPIALELPLAPGVAAAQAGVEIDLGRIAAGLSGPGGAL